MQLLRLAQLHKAKDLSKEQKLELARKIDTVYNIPIDTYGNLQDKSYSGYNCLHIAAMKLDFDFIHEFINHGADPLKQGIQNGKTPLHIALDVKSNCKGKKMWEISGKLQECQVVNTLLLAHVESNNSLNPKCNSGISHLHIACIFNCTKAVRFFLGNEEAIDQVTDAADSYWPSYTPLHFAIRYSSVEAAEILLDNGADLFAKNAESLNPLQLLISRMLNVADFINMGQRTVCTPYQEELKRLEEIVSIVIEMESGNGVNFLDDTGLTIFHMACVLRDSSIAASFLNDNLDLNMAVKTNSKFWPGWTPLHFAACLNAETVKLLMLKGADISIKNAKGETPLDMCLKRYSLKIVHSILSTKNEFKNILLSDESTMLWDLLLAVDNIASFHDYLGNLDRFDISVCPTAPVLSGYNLLHLALSMNEKTKSWDDFLEESDSRESIETLPQIYNCTEDESRVYLDRIDACLTVGCSVDAKNRDGLTPIHLAFKTLFVKSEILEKLLNYCEKDVVDPESLSHLHIACAVGNQKAVQTLLEKGANIDAVTMKSIQWYEKPNSNLISVNANSTPLHVAVTFGHAHIIEILLDRGADLYAVDSEGFTPIHLSIANGSNEIAKIIVSHPQGLIDLVSKEGLSHLHVAAFAGDTNVVEKLILNGADVNRFIDVEVPGFLSRFAGKSPLQIATRISRDKARLTVKTLIEFGADIYANDTLQCLMGETDFDFSQYFVERLELEENVNEPIDSSGLTLLHVACSRFDVKWAKALINVGADVNARIRYDEDYRGQWKGYTPLHVLVSRKYRKIDSTVDPASVILGKLLLDQGADVTIDSTDGTPLHLSYSSHVRNSLKVDNSLVDGQDPIWPLDNLTSWMLKSQTSYHVNPTNRDGFSHFHFYCMFDSGGQKVQQYLENGVDVNHSTNPFSQTYPGYSGIHFAFAYRSLNAANMLIESGADVNAENAYGNTPLHLMISLDLMNHQSEIHKLHGHGANFKAKNLLGQTLIDVLMTTDRFRLEHIHFFLFWGSKISCRSDGNASPGPVALIMQKAVPEQRLEMLRKFVDVCDAHEAKRNGYDPISEMISMQGNRNERPTLAFGILIELVQKLIDAGCDVNPVYEKGDAELHKCILLKNTPAVEAWLLLGADMNACDILNHKFSRYSTDEIQRLLALRVYTMKILGLHVSADSNLIYRRIVSKLPIDASVEEGIVAEPIKAETFKVTETLTASAFLSEFRAVSFYSRLPMKERESIDAFFKRITYLNEEFPLLGGVMMLQYKKALVRSKLIERAKEVLTNECEMYLPDLCLECVLSYLWNDEMKYLIEHSGETARACKRRRIE